MKFKKTPEQAEDIKNNKVQFKTSKKKEK